MTDNAEKHDKTGVKNPGLLKRSREVSNSYLSFRSSVCLVAKTYTLATFFYYLLDFTRKNVIHLFDPVTLLRPLPTCAEPVSEGFEFALPSFGFRYQVNRQRYKSTTIPGNSELIPRE